MNAGFWTARRAATLAVALALAFALAEFVVIARLELSFDEAYYVLWSRHLAFGYLDHPPMVAMWIRLSTLIFGSTEFGVRALNVVVFALTPAMVGFAAARLFDAPRVGAFAALAWLATPLIAGGFLATPDTPLIFFSIVALLGLVEAARGRAWGWAIVGAALGLALQSKFSALFVCAGLALALIVAPSLRRWRFSPAPYLALLAAAAIFAPFVYWNAAHGWETFAKQFSRVPADHLGLQYIPDFLVAQTGLANPLFVIAVAGWLFHMRRKADAALSPDADARRILLAFVAPALAYFLIHALHERVQANWTGPVFPAFAMLAGAAAARGPVWARRVAGAGVALGSVAIAVALLHAATFWPSFGAADLLARIGGWRDLVAEVDARARSENSAFLIVRGYASTALLLVYGEEARPVMQEEERERWEFLPPPDMKAFDRPGLAFSDADRGFESELARHFRRVEPLQRLARNWGGVGVGTYELFRVSGPIPPVFEGP